MGRMRLRIDEPTPPDERPIRLAGRRMMADPAARRRALAEIRARARGMCKKKGCGRGGSCGDCGR